MRTAHCAGENQLNINFVTGMIARMLIARIILAITHVRTTVVMRIHPIVLILMNVNEKLITATSMHHVQTDPVILLAIAMPDIQEMEL